MSIAYLVPFTRTPLMLVSHLKAVFAMRDTVVTQEDHALTSTNAWLMTDEEIVRMHVETRMAVMNAIAPFQATLWILLIQRHASVSEPPIGDHNVLLAMGIVIMPDSTNPGLAHDSFAY